MRSHSATRAGQAGSRSALKAKAGGRLARPAKAAGCLARPWLAALLLAVSGVAAAHASLDATDPADGAVLQAWLESERETTLKKFYLEGEQVRLQPANVTMDPIYTSADNVRVQGKLVSVVRQID